MIYMLVFFLWFWTQRLSLANMFPVAVSSEIIKNCAEGSEQIQHGLDGVFFGSVSIKCGGGTQN
jgi:hypothetical protein